jgi:hypothetical protein
MPGEGGRKAKQEGRGREKTKEVREREGGDNATKRERERESGATRRGISEQWREERDDAVGRKKDAGRETEA